MADAALLEAAREAQLQLSIRNDVSKLPLWFGSPSKDTITGRQWVERVERAIAATGWNDDQTMSFHSYVVLRGVRLTFKNIYFWGVSNVSIFEIFEIRSSSKTSCVIKEYYNVFMSGDLTGLCLYMCWGYSK